MDFKRRIALKRLLQLDRKRKLPVNNQYLCDHISILQRIRYAVNLTTRSKQRRGDRWIAPPLG